MTKPVNTLEVTTLLSRQFLDNLDMELTPEQYETLVANMAVFLEAYTQGVAAQVLQMVLSGNAPHDHQH